MSDREADLSARLSKLETAFIQQGEGIALHVANTNTLVQQLYALFLVNTALVAALRDRDLLDVEMLRANVLDELGDEDREGNVALHVNAVLGTLKPADLRAANEAAAAKLKEASRARFTVFEGGQSNEEPES